LAGRWFAAEPFAVGLVVVVAALAVVMYGWWHDRRALRCARANERRFGSLYRLLPGPAFTVDADGQLTDVNPATVRTSGFGAAELTGRSIHELVHPAQRDQVADELAEVLRGTARRFDAHLRDRSGEPHVLDVILAPLHGPDRVHGAIGAAFDVTGERAAAAELGRFHQVLDALADPVVTIDPAARSCVYLNASACQLLEVVPSEATGAHPATLHPAWDDAYLDALLRDLAGREEVEEELLRDDERAYAVRWQRIDRLLVATARDTTDWYRARRALSVTLDHEHTAVARLRETQALQESFLSAVSHQLRTPLASVLGFAQTLQRIGVLDAAQTAMVERIVDNSQRLERVLDDVFDLNRLAVAELQPTLETVDIHEVVDRVRSELDPRTADRVVHHRTGPACAWVDPVMLARVLRQLVDNAVVHDPSGAPIDVRVHVDDEACRVIVEDHGPGIPAGMHRSIFDPFRHGPAAASDPDPGTGVGLALVDRFVRANGGRVSAEDRPGGGARLVVTLAVAPAGPGADAPVADGLAGSAVAEDRGGWEQLAVAAHELLNPLAVADGYAQLLRTAPARAEVDVPEFADRIVRNLELTRMVLQRLRDSEVDPSQLAIEPQLLDLGAMVTETVADLAATVAADRPLEVATPDDPVHAIADPTRLRQVLFNLVSNAARYSPAHRPIELTVRAGEHALLEVRDHGPGIDPADVDRVFGRRERLPNSAVPRGLGLGLYVSRSIARAHGGELRHEPDDPGSRFVVQLPLAASPAAIPVATSRDLPPGA
jgi:PAS domain S-box-containing protein